MLLTLMRFRPHRFAAPLVLLLAIWCHPALPADSTSSAGRSNTNLIRTAPKAPIGGAPSPVSASPGRPNPIKPKAVPIPLRPRGETNSDERIGGALVQPIAPGVFRVGRVRLDQVKREVSIPVVVNQREGPVEYLAVTAAGKLHESVLRSDAEPFQIHTAMLLLGLEGDPAPRTADPAGASAARDGGAAGSGPIKVPSTAKVAGSRILVELAWDQDGREMRRPAGDLVLGRKLNRELGVGSWVYNGSAMVSGRFLAQMYGLIIAVVTDGNALINSVAEGHEDDDLWTVNGASLPPAGVALELVFRAADAEAAKPEAGHGTNIGQPPGTVPPATPAPAKGR